MATHIYNRMRHYWGQIRQSKLIKNAGVYVSGHFVQKGLTFLLLPIWARFLSPADYGIVGTLTVYGGVLFTLYLLGLHGAAVRQYYDHLGDVAEQRSYVSSLVMFLVGLLTLLTITASLWGEPLWSMYISQSIPFQPYGHLMLWTTFGLAIAQIPIALYQAQQKAGAFVLVQYSRFGLEVTSILLLVVALRWQAYGMLLAQLIVSLTIAAVVLYLFVRLWFVWQFRWRYIGLGLAFGLPLVPHTLANQVLVAADRFILEQFVSLHDVGLYNIGYMMGMSLLVVVSGINLAWAPYYYRLMQTVSHPEPEIIQATSLTLAVVGGLCLVAILFVGEVVYIVMPVNYHGAVQYVAPILLGYVMVSLYYFAVVPIFYYKKTLWLPVTTGLCAGLNVVLNLWLIPIYGAIAAAWTTTVTQALLFGLVLLIARRYQQLNYPLARYLLLTAGLLSLILLLPPVTRFSWGFFMFKLGLLLLGGLCLYSVLIRPALTIEVGHETAHPQSAEPK